MLIRMSRRSVRALTAAASAAMPASLLTSPAKPSALPGGAERVDLGRGLLAVGALARGDHHGGAGLDQRGRRHAADAGRRAGHQRGLAGHRKQLVEIAHRFLPCGRGSLRRHRSDLACSCLRQFVKIRLRRMTMSDMALGMTERLKPIHERVAAHGARRDHAARRGVPGRSRQGRRPLGLHRAADRDPRRAEGQGQGARPVEFLADRLRARLRPDHRRICLSRRGDGQGASRRRDLQLLGARHRQHGGAGALRLERAQASNGWRRCSRARSARPI